MTVVAEDLAFKQLCFHSFLAPSPDFMRYLLLRINMVYLKRFPGTTFSTRPMTSQPLLSAFSFPVFLIFSLDAWITIGHLCLQPF